ncbi:MAG: hypothetical protein K0S32_1058 [Bacteroidetes bacterium]|jgi:hypothetical protein|nr:hypothetical protein [Bacteroidota bacterium]
MKRLVFLYFLFSALFSISQPGGFDPEVFNRQFKEWLTHDPKQKKIDSLTAQLRKDSVHIYRFRKIRPYLNYHERNSLGNPKIINFYGPQLGVVLYEKHIIGLGDYYSTPKTKLPYSTYDENMEVKRSIEIRYLTFFYQYILVNRRFFEVHLPVEFGYGNFHSSFINSSDFYYKNTVSKFNLGAAGLQFVFKPVKWIGISSNLGYRTASERIIEGYYYSIGVWVGFKPISTDVNYYLIKRKKYKQAVSAIMAG